MKQAVDKMSEYLCDIRDWCNYTVVPIIHTNRDITSIDNIRFAKDELYPTSEHLKDTGEKICIEILCGFRSCLYICIK